MGTNAIDRGPTSHTVASNIRLLREIAGLSLDGLSRRLAELGRPIRSTGLHRIEMNERRVDVDDLVAAAVALDVTPDRLLLGPVADDTRRAILPEVAETNDRLWAWASGQMPLPHQVKGVLPARVEVRCFQLRCRPHTPNRPDEPTSFAQQLPGLGRVAEAVMAALDDGIDLANIVDCARTVGASRPLNRRLERSPSPGPQPELHFNVCDQEGQTG